MKPTRERLLEIFDIDIITGVIRWKKPSSHRVKVGDIAGGKPSGAGYIEVRFDGLRCYHHHIIWFIVKGYWPTQLDHIDTNKLNNAITNLREATYSQNHCNKSSQSNNTSGYKGVSWNKRAQKWLAKINHNHKPKDLGLYDDKNEAAMAYNEAAIKYHGEFAKLNVIEKD